MRPELLWKVKVAARLHDPAEKALVLLRDPAGHENGTSLAIARLAGLVRPEQDTIPWDAENPLAGITFRRGIPREIYSLVERADWWAAAADRPQWPLEKKPRPGAGGEVYQIVDWAQVRWYKQAVLIHPLSGKQFELPGGLEETEIEDIKKRCFHHLADILKSCGAEDEEAADWRKIALALWRFGPEIREPEGSGRLGELWKQLPADTRVPDHSIWDHLDLVSAFAGAFAADADGQAALLVFTLGPVQSFIQAARKTEDLWAGSHLLSRLLWEAARPLCEELGPDAIVFPRLRGIALVDLWLRDRMGLPPVLFENCKNCRWRNCAPDANPLFAAALPNRFVAIVPASRAVELAERCRDEVRAWLLDLGLRVVDRLLETAGYRTPGTERDESVPAYQQMREQLRNYPEVHWAVTPFSLIRARDASRQTALDVRELEEAMAPFYEVAPDKAPGFLDSDAWKLLRGDIALPDGTTFYLPNPGVLYPAIYDLNERLLAAAKSVRRFDPARHEGWRCTLTGEAEWLTTDRAHLHVPKGERASGKVETLWTRIAERKPAWAKRGEHLSALPAIKRLWPTLFAEEVKGETRGLTERFVVSTHTMALARQLEKWLQAQSTDAEVLKELEDRIAATQPGQVALPRRLVVKHRDNPRLELARQIPALLDAARESEDEARWQEDQRIVRLALAGVRKIEDAPRLETYYGLLMMDGDRMGQILSGDAETSITYGESFHPQVSSGVQERWGRWRALESYLRQRRPVSPNRHMAISAALSDFSQVVVPYLIEEKYPGRLIYSGGDDVLAMLPAGQVVEAAQYLRWAYSGSFPEDEQESWDSLRKQNRLVARNGFAWLNGRLMRMMGTRATASCGVVIAHHQAPLSFVLRQLREAEQKAKAFSRPARNGSAGTRDRDALHLVVVKRSGSTLEVTLEWGEQVQLLEEMREFLAREDVSRRAVYHASEWLERLPDAGGRLDKEMLGAVLAYQFRRQSERGAKEQASDLARRLALVAAEQSKPKYWLTNFLHVADFLAREQRGEAGRE
jgi:CRISPR-associated protein Cmr2